MKLEEGKTNADLRAGLGGLNDLMTDGLDWAHASDVSSFLKDTQRCDLHWRRIQSLFDENRALVGRRKRSHRWQYRLLDEGKRFVGAGDDSVLFVDPAKAVQSVTTLHGLLGNFKGVVRVCDPYLDSSSIEHLDALGGRAMLRYLTFNIKSEGMLRRTISAFAAGGRTLEVRQMPKAVLHDRYIVDDSQLVILGSSLNGFGRKQCFIIKAGQDMRKAMLKQFEESWSSATVWS